MRNKVVKYKLGGDMSSIAMMLQQLLATQNNRVQDEKGSGWGVASRAGSEALAGVSAGSAFGPIGSIVGGGVGLVSGILGGLKEKKAAEDARVEETRMNKVLDRDRSTAILQDYPTKGLGVTGYYAAGGELGDSGNLPKVISGGMLKHLGKNSAEVVGDTHEQDSNKDGSTGVIVTHKGQKSEIEAGEVVYRDKVYTNSMLVPGTTQTFADIAKDLAESFKFNSEEDKRTKAEDDMKANTYLTKNKGYRNSLKFKENPLLELFEMQEALKAQMLAEAQQAQQAQQAEGEMPVGKLGLDLDAVSKVSPFIDNIANLLLTNRSAKLPTPILDKAPRLNTRFDDSGMQANIANSEAVNQALVAGNTSSGSVLASRLGQIRGASLDAKNSLATQKVNTETELANRNILAETETSNKNRGLLNNYRMLKMQRADDIDNRVSANAANLTEDLGMAQRDKNLAIRDKQTMLIELTKFAESGVIERTGLMEAFAELEKGASMEDILKKYGKKGGVTSTTTGNTNIPSNLTYGNLASSIAKYLPNKI